MEKIDDQDYKDQGLAKGDPKMMGRRIKLPPIETIFPIKRNPFHETKEVKAMCQLIKEFSSMSDKHYSAIQDICLFTAYFHPFVTDLTKYVNLCRAMQLFFVVDDHIECDWGQIARNEELDHLIWDQINDCFERLLDGTNRISMAEWKPYVVALYICFEEIFKEYNLVQRRRTARAYHEWGLGNKIEGQLIRAKHQFKTIEDYLEVRKLSIGSKCVYGMIEYADGLQLSDVEWHMLNNYLEHGGFLITLANDLQSIEREMIEHKDSPHKITNSVALIMNWDNCSVEEALKKIVVIFNDYENRTKLIKTQLLDRPNISKDMKTFIERAEYVMGGNLRAGLILRRYCKVSEIDE